jgi:hypothetical protein
MEEIWKDVKDYDGIYQVSNLGRFKSLKNKKEKILKLGNAMGYQIIRLYKNKKMNTIKAHRLIANHFIDNQENKPQVNHKNGIKTDNRVENLEWATCSENHRHAINSGLKVFKFGETHVNSKLKDEDVKKIKYELNQYEVPELAKLFNISRSTIYLIRKNKNWKHI